MSNKQVTILNKDFELMLTDEEIKKSIVRIASELNNDYKEKTPLFICVLNGSFLFAADLLKEVTIDCEVSFVKLASYIGIQSSGNVNTLIGLDQEIEGRDIIIIEDIVDTGLTLENLMNQLTTLNPSSINVATMLFKPDACIGKYKPNYTGIEIDDKFVVGYGLDYNGLGRNLTDIYKVID